MTLLETYHYFNIEIADPRTNNWPLVSSFIYPIGIPLIYLYIVFSVIPRFMQNKRPYQLKKFIVAYNIYQVAACTYITYGIITSGWTTTYDWFCQDVDRSNSPEALRMANFIWLLMIVKLSEFIETFVFALRKKQNQITFLHVYHHASSYMLMWCAIKYSPGGTYSFPGILNNIVHIMMYTYYLLTLHKSPLLQIALAKFKPYMTMIQMGQFVILLMYAAQGIRPSCDMSKKVLYIFIPNVFLIFYLFYDFYRKTFLQKNKKP